MSSACIIGIKLIDDYIYIVCNYSCGNDRDSFVIKPSGVGDKLTLLFDQVNCIKKVGNFSNPPWVAYQDNGGCYVFREKVEMVDGAIGIEDEFGSIHSEK